MPSSELEALVNIAAQTWFMELLAIAAHVFESKWKLTEEIKNTVQQPSADNHVWYTPHWEMGRKEEALKVASVQTGMYCITGVLKENTMKLRKLRSLNNSKVRI